MAIGTEQVTVAVCDACGRRTYGEPGKQPEVITGQATDFTGSQEKTATWSACGPKHVGNAVAAAIKAAQPVVRSAFSSRPTVVAPTSTSVPKVG
jgi:hypothetical protein